MHAHDRTLLASLGFADPDKKNPLHDFACQYLALRENHERIAGMFKPNPPARTTCMVRNMVTGEDAHVEWRGRRKIDLSLGSPRLEMPISKGEGRFKTSIGFVDVSLPFDWCITDEGESYGWEIVKHVEYEEKASHDRPYNLGEGESVERARFSRSSIGTDRKDLSAAFPSHVESVKVTYRGGNLIYRIPQCGRAWVACSVENTEYHTVNIEVKIGRVNMGDVLRQVALYREYIYVDGYDGSPWFLATPYAIDRTDKATLEGANIRHILLGEKFQRWAAERQSAPALAESPEL